MSDLESKNMEQKHLFLEIDIWEVKRALRFGTIQQRLDQKPFYRYMPKNGNLIDTFSAPR